MSMVKLEFIAKTNKEIEEPCVDYLIFSRVPNMDYVQVDSEEMSTYVTEEGIRCVMLGTELLDGTPITADELRKLNFVGVSVYDDYPDPEFEVSEAKITSIEEE